VRQHDAVGHLGGVELAAIEQRVELDLLAFVGSIGSPSVVFCQVCISDLSPARCSLMARRKAPTISRERRQRRIRFPEVERHHGRVFVVRMFGSPLAAAQDRHALRVVHAVVALRAVQTRGPGIVVEST
jgi:hypothetical protein